MAIRGKGRGLGVAAVVGVGAVVLAGCDGSEAPVTPTPTVTAPVMPSSSASPTPEVTVSPSPSADGLTDEELLAHMPAGAHFPDIQGAVVTAEFFLEQYAPMVHTGDTTVWDALSAEACGYCSDMSDYARELRIGGYRFEGGDLDPRQPPTLSRLEEDDSAVVVLSVEEAASMVFDDAGAEAHAQGARRLDFALHLELRGDHWVVREVVAEEAV